MSGSAKRFWSGGEPFIWLTGGALTLSLILVTGLIALILVNALSFFWPKDVARITLADGSGSSPAPADAGPLVDAELEPVETEAGPADDEATPGNEAPDNERSSATPDAPHRSRRRRRRRGGRGRGRGGGSGGGAAEPVPAPA